MTGANRRADVTPEKVAEFYDEFNARQQRDFVYGNLRVAAALDRVKKQVTPDTGSILDIGCGCGQATWELARENPYVQVVGLDISPKNVEVANRLFDLPNLSYRVSDLSEPPGTQFDIVAMLDVYEHFPRDDWGELNATLGLCLADNGVLVITTPTPLHQDYLREHEPDGLQIVDETVELEDLLRLAKDIDAVPILFEWLAVWNKFDYTHFVASRNASFRKPKTAIRKKKNLLSRIANRIRKQARIAHRKKMVRERLGSPFENKP